MHYHCDGNINTKKSVIPNSTERIITKHYKAENKHLQRGWNC